MSLKVSSRITYGNASAVKVLYDTEIPEIIFTASPNDNAEALWFCFDLFETESDKVAASKVKITLKYLRNLDGCNNALELKPVYQPKGQQWFRTKSGHPYTAEDGQTSASWTIPYPTPSTTVAFCYPYGKSELTKMLQKSKGYWHQDSIGLSQRGRTITRVSNSYGKVGGHQLGIYIITRQNAGETPSSWVLDGMLNQFSRNKKNNFLIWTIPLADVDGIIKGDYGRNNTPNNINHAWDIPATRYETAVFQNDIQEWKKRCKPYLVINLQSPSGDEADGIYSLLPDPDSFEVANKEATAWANVFKQALSNDYAASDFNRIAQPTTTTLSDYVRETLDCNAITINIPYASCGKTIMQQKQYREVGKQLADAILHRNHGNNNK